MKDIEAVNTWKPDYIGYVFAPGRRKISLEEAQKLSRQLASDICPAGVFVNASTDLIVEAVSRGIIRAVQLHGQEDQSQIYRLKEMLPADIPVIKAVSVTCLDSVTAWKDSDADYLLLDAVRGGEGVPFDHDLLSGIEAIQKPWFLAGGMNQENVTEAIGRFHPYGIDVSSGVETEGWKDPEKIKNIIRSVRNE